MKRSRYSEQQIACALQQAEYGTPVKEVIRKMGITEQTFYRWKKKYGDLGSSELRRLKQLEEKASPATRERSSPDRATHSNLMSAGLWILYLMPCSMVAGYGR